MNLFNATRLYTLKWSQWLILCYVYLTILPQFFFFKCSSSSSSSKLTCPGEIWVLKAWWRQNVGRVWKPGDWLAEVHFSGLTLVTNMMLISDECLEMHLWREWTRDPDLRNTNHKWKKTRQNALLKNRKNYVKVCTLNRIQKACKKKMDYLTVSNNTEKHFRFVREVQMT